MTMSDYRGIVEFLRRNFPNAKKYKDRDTMNDGWLLVKDMDAQTVMGNAVAFMQTYPYPPDIKELACQNTGEAEQAKEGERYHVPASLIPYIQKMAEKFKDDPPCMLISKKSGDLEHPKGLTCGQIIEQFFPDPICDGCKRKGDPDRCTALFFQERDEKRKMLKEEMEDAG